MNRKERRREERARRKEQQRAEIPPTPQQTVMVLSDGGVIRVEEEPWTEWVNTGERLGDGSTTYENSRYIVHVYPAKQQTDGWPPIIHVSIRHVHNIAITDFRDFQRIKTELISPDAEAVQIFPAESRLVDSCNQYHLWVFAPPSEEDEYPTIPVGYFYGRDVLTDGENPDGTNQR